MISKNIYKFSKLIIVIFLFLLLFFNLSYLYLGVSCKSLSPEQMCSCYEIKQKHNSKYIDEYLKICSKYRLADD